MRKTMLIAASLLMAATVNAQKEKSETLEGNGNLITKEVTVSSFNALKASGVYELNLSQGNKEGVKIEADENLQQYFTVRNEGSKLVIDMKELKNKNLKLKNKMKVFVTFKDLKGLELNMVGSVHATSPLSFADLDIENSSVGHVDLDLSATTLNLKNNSVGKVKLSGKAQNAQVTNNGVGNLDAGTFVVQTMNIDNSGVGGAEVNASKELKVKDTMLGRVKNRGNAPVKKNNKVTI
ncbi:MAG TPA: head GIN domain-containing protein [Flavisolibacter sp.]|nr:head GIN domain-containing protein [Flavisolibacter sp.]